MAAVIGWPVRSSTKRHSPDGFTSRNTKRPSSVRRKSAAPYTSPSALSAPGAKRWTKMASDRVLVTYDCESLKDALDLAAEVASGKMR